MSIPCKRGDARSDVKMDFGRIFVTLMPSPTAIFLNDAQMISVDCNYNLEIRVQIIYIILRKHI